MKMNENEMILEMNQIIKSMKRLNENCDYSLFYEYNFDNSFDEMIVKMIDWKFDYIESLKNDLRNLESSNESIEEINRLKKLLKDY